MKTAEYLQNNYSTVEVEPFTFFFPLQDKVILESRVQVQEIGALKVQGFATRAQNPLGEPTISVEVQFVKHLGVDVKVVLTHFQGMDAIKEAALRHAERVTFAPKPTKESVLKAIVETVYALKEYQPLTFLNPLTIRLSDNDHHIVTVAGLVVTLNTKQLIVLQGDGEGWPLEASDLNAERMVAEIYKRLEKLFPEQVKAIQ